MKAKRVKRLDPALPLTENVARIVEVRLAELRDFVPEALDPAAVGVHHDMRIAAKRLRYVLEATGFCLGGPAKAAQREARKLQDVLGEIHDVDVMVPQLADYRSDLRALDAEAVMSAAGGERDIAPELASRAPHRTSYRGLEVLEVYLTARRSRLFESFRELWLAQEKKKVWSALERAAGIEVEAAKQRRRAAERAERARAELERAELARREAAASAERAAEALAEAERASQL